MLKHEDEMDEFTANTLLILDVTNLYETQGLERREPT